MVRFAESTHSTLNFTWCGKRVCGMKLLWSLLKRRVIWERIAIERLTEPLHLNIASLGVALCGSTRLKIRFDLLVRQQHAYGLLRAADWATAHGLKKVHVVELGVGTGTGLLNLCELAERIAKETGVAIQVTGFDTGVGMPAPVDHRDHPELYKEGWFPMDAEALRARLPGHGELILGPLSETLPPFVENLSADAPLGFAALDVDYYKSSVEALALFKGEADRYLPVLPVYVDDVHLPTHNPYCGELLAIREFNETNAYRKLIKDDFLPHRRVFKRAEWLDHMYLMQVLDHPVRQDVSPPGRIAKPENPYL